MKSHPFEIGDKVFCKTHGAGVVVYVTDWMADVVLPEKMVH